MRKKMILDENFDNVQVDVTPVSDATFVNANDEHDENKKNYEDVIKENEKIALDAIPKEGDTGKKVTSKALKQMHLSEELFTEEAYTLELYPTHNSEPKRVHYNSYEDAFDAAKSELNGKYDEIYINRRTMNGPSTENSWSKEDGWYKESLNESKEDEMEVRLMKYIKKFQNHYKINSKAMGKALTSIGKSVEILDTDMNESLSEAYDPEIGGDVEDFILDLNEMKTALHSITYATGKAEEIAWDFEDQITALKRSVNTKEESLQYQIANEQLQRFNEGKMPKNWNPKTFVENLVKKGHITKAEATRLTESLLSESNDKFELQAWCCDGNNFARYREPMYWRKVGVYDTEEEAKNFVDKARKVSRQHEGDGSVQIIKYGSRWNSCVWNDIVEHN